MHVILHYLIIYIKLKGIILKRNKCFFFVLCKKIYLIYILIF